MDDSVKAWVPYVTNLPNVPVRDLEITLDDEKLTAATYGRGIWQTEIPVELPDNEVQLLKIISPNLSTVSCGNSMSIELEVENKGLQDVLALVINYKIDGVANSKLWAGLIKSGDKSLISIENIAVEFGNHKLEVEVVLADDAYSDNNTGISNFIVNQVWCF